MCEITEDGTIFSDKLINLHYSPNVSKVIKSWEM
jgi:hypothetical protein